MGWLVRPIFATYKEANERLSLLGVVISNGAAQHWVLAFERIEHGLLSYCAINHQG